MFWTHDSLYIIPPSCTAVSFLVDTVLSFAGDSVLSPTSRSCDFAISFFVDTTPSVVRPSRLILRRRQSYNPLIHSKLSSSFCLFHFSFAVTGGCENTVHAWYSRTCLDKSLLDVGGVKMSSNIPVVKLYPNTDHDACRRWCGIVHCL